jgi:hypothetical protein
MAARVGLTNLIATATISASTQATGYSAENVKTPQRPFAPWKTTTTAGTQSVTADLGSAKAVDAVALVHANFAIARIQADDAPTFNSAGGNPQYDQLITLTRNPWNGRYSHIHRPVTVPRRYWRIQIPNQATTDGATEYRLGGWWAGVFVALPRGLRWSYRIHRIKPKEIVGPDHEGWDEELVLGHLRTHIVVHRHAVIGATPGLNDKLAEWLELERQWSELAFALFALRDDDPSQVGVMKLISDADWEVRIPAAEADFELKEVLGP